MLWVDMYALTFFDILCIVVENSIFKLGSSTERLPQ
jgi:hypothetical protein